MDDMVKRPVRGRPRRDPAETDAAVLQAIATSGPMAAKMLRRHLHMAIMIVRASLDRLVASGSLHKVGKGNDTRYVLPGHSVRVPEDRGKGLQARVLAFLNDHPQPFQPLEIADQLGADRRKTRSAIEALVTRGALVGTGVAQARLVGLPAVMASLPVLPPRVRRSARAYRAVVRRTSTPAEREAARTERAITGVLATGASYSVREIWLRVRHALPGATPEGIEAACIAMMREGRLARHVVGTSGCRYQNRVSRVRVPDAYLSEAIA